MIVQATACGGGPRETTSSEPPEPRFEETTLEAGIDYTGPSSGLAIGDFDGDGWEDVYSSNHGSPVKLFRNHGGRFADATEHLRGPERGDAHGAAWADFDSDGDQDLLQLIGAQRGRGRGPNHLYINSDGTLEVAATDRGLSDPLGRGRIPLWLDWNGDRHLDALINNAPRAEAPSLLLLGRSEGFEPMGLHPWGTFNSQHAGLLAIDERPALMVAEGDGKLRFLQLGAPPSRGRPAAGSEELPPATDWASGDFDGDGHTDLVVLRGARGPRLRFEGANRLVAHLPVTQSERGVELVSDGPLRIALSPASKRWWQTENVFIGSVAGHPAAMEFDLEVATAEGYPEEVPPSDKWVRIGYRPDFARWRIAVGATGREVLNVVVESDSPISGVEPLGFPLDGSTGRARYLAGPDFGERTAEARLEGIDTCRSIVAADFDNDADIDLYIVCSAAGVNHRNRFMLNDGEGRFEALEDSGGAGGTSTGSGEGAVVTDYDRDGWLDLIVANGAGLRPFNDGPLELFRNRPGSAGWVEIELHGTRSSADALGTIVVLTSDLGRQVRLRGSETRPRGQSRGVIHFGLGAARIHSLDVTWSSGLRQRLLGLPPNRVLHLLEPSTAAGG